MSNGLDEHAALEHAARIRALNGRFDGLTLLAGIECDVLADGTLDLSHDCLAQLDIVIASVHAHYSQGEAQTTERILKALECPWVDILGHPLSRRLLQREPLKVNFDQIVSTAVANGAALEINCQPDRLDLSDSFARTAHERGSLIAISTDAHSTMALGNVRWGIQVARRAWLTPEAVLNTRPLDEMRQLLRRNRRAA
jgi:DNA polymerase (family 10)